MRRACLVWLVVTAVIVAGCGGSASGPGAVMELTRVDTLRAAFNDDKGDARIVLLLSPT